MRGLHEGGPRGIEPLCPTTARWNVVLRPRTEASTAMPREPATCCVRLNIEGAMPALRVGTAFIAAVMTGVTSKPSPLISVG
jgi:hypothetical protein